MQDEAASAENAKKVYITFNKAVQATNSGGFTISGSSTALYFESAVSITTITTTNDTVVLTLNDWPSASESGTVKLSYNISLGNVKDTNDGAVQSFTEQTIEFRNYSTMGNNADIIKPWLVSATVENDTPSVVRVVFSEPVTADAAKFLVKVNTTPKTNIADLTNTTGLPVMDFSAKTRTIANAAAVGGSSPSATWDLTMTTPAGFGEILRLATGTSATNNSDAVSNNLPTYTPCDGAAYDAANNLLPQIPQFIIRNLVQRTKGDFETAAGLYRNGIGVEAVNDGSGGQLYQNAMNLLKTSGSYPQAGEIITIVIASNQTYTAANTFTSIHVPTSLQSNPPTIILTTPTGNTTDYTITVTGNEHGMVLRNGLTLVMDEHVIMKHDTTTNNFPFLSVNDGGKFILNGGALKDNTLIATTNDHAYRGGAIRGGGGSYGCYFVINSGEISGNTVNMNIAEGNSHGGAGAIYMYQYAAFVMHGGTIARNTFNYTYSTAAATAKAGAIADMTSSSATYHANSSFFMTGGIISGNSVSGASNGVSSGGVVVSGAFQKNGGTIYGDDAGDAALRNNNTMTGSGIVKAKSVAVINQATANPDPTASIGAGTESDPTRPAAVVRNGTTGPNDSLFVASYKTAKANAGINTVPDWAKSFWDDTPTP
jgi:hypothetical protein